MSVLPHEIEASEPGENPSRTLTWKSLTFLIHIKCRTIDDRFPLPLLETFFYSSLGVPIPALIGPAQQCAYNAFHYDTFGDHLQTCQTQSLRQRIYRFTTGLFSKLGALLSSVGHKVKIHKITP